MLLNHFVTPEKYAMQQVRNMDSRRGKLLLASCTAGDVFASQVMASYLHHLERQGSRSGLLTVSAIDKQFGDGETCARLEIDVSGCDAYLFQSFVEPDNRSIDENYMAFLIGVRSLRENGARHVTGVLPYLAYSRQNKPTQHRREPTTARLMADLCIAAGMDGLMTWHAHAEHIHATYPGIQIDHLDALQLFASEYQRFQGRDDVILIAPDAGAVKLVSWLGSQLDLHCGVAIKRRPAPEKLMVDAVIGDLTGKRVAIVVDDLISSGGTVEATVLELVQQHGIEEVYVGVSHNLGRPEALQRLIHLWRNANLLNFMCTDSTNLSKAWSSQPFIETRSLVDTFAFLINRAHYEMPAGDVLRAPLIHLTA